MSDTSRRLSENKLKELFDKYDSDKNNKLDLTKLNHLVSDVLKEVKNVNSISSDDQLIITKTVSDLLANRNSENNTTLDWNEFSSYYRGKNIIEESQRNFKILI